jgi:hypothetical protein
MTTEDATAPKCPKCGLSATCELCRLYGPLQHPAPAPVEVDGEAMSEQVDVARLLALAYAIQYGSYEDDEDARDEVAQLRAAAAEITALRERAKDAERLREVLRELLELRGIGEGPPQQLLTAEQWWGRWRAAWKAAALAARGEKP